MYDDEEWLHMVMELCLGLDLFDWISRWGGAIGEGEGDSDGAADGGSDSVPSIAGGASGQQARQHAF